MKSANVVQLGVSFLLGLTVLLAACDQTPKSNNASLNSGSADAALPPASYTGKPAAQNQLDQLSTPASLNHELPDEAVAYARIPSFWGFFNAPKKSMLDRALRDTKNVEAILKVREGLGRYFNDLKMSEKIFFDLALNRLQSPIEVALLSLEQGKTYAFVARAHLGIKSAPEFNDLLSKFAAQNPALKILSPLDDKGIAQLTFQEHDVHIHFAATRLTLVAGKVSKDQLAKINALLKPRSAPHAMAAVEKQIDTSGQGVFFWTDPPRLVQIEPLVGENRSFFAPIGFINSFAFGWGVADGKSRLRMHWGVPFDFPRYTGVMGSQFNVSVAGSPTIAVAMNLPGPEQWEALKIYVRGPLNSAQAKSYEEAMSEFRKVAGFDLDELIAAIGGHAAFFIDDSGEFLTLQIRDKTKFKKIVEQMAKMPGGRYQVNTVQNLSVHHLEFGIPEIARKDISAVSKDLEFLGLIARLKYHYYWVEDGDYLVLAGAPQPLVDRARHPQLTKLGTWLRKNQGVRSDQSVLFASFRFQDSPRMLYHTYLSWLGNLGDLANTPIDLAQMPTARELNLPKYGSYSMQLDLVKGGIAVELVFENNPFELFMGSQTMAMIFPIVLVALAVPAYVEYNRRALLLRP